MHLMHLPCVLTRETSSLLPVPSVGPEFSCNLCRLPVGPESIPYAGTLLLHPELGSNHLLYPDLKSPLFSIFQPPDAFNWPAPSGSCQDYHTHPLVSWCALCASPYASPVPPNLLWCLLHQQKKYLAFCLSPLTLCAGRSRRL